MRAVVQRVTRAAVHLDGVTVAAIETGFLVLLGVAHQDTEQLAERMAAKIAGLRLFEDPEGKMNLGLPDVGGSVLCVSQFTLYGDVRRGRRPSFDEAARPDLALRLYDAFCDAITREGIRCLKGAFGEHMLVELVNDGPVTLIVDSAELDRPRRP